MQPNGFILVGVQLEPTALRQPSQTMLARFTFDGVLDTTFGTQGIAVATGSGGCTALAQLSNGGYPVVNAQGVVEFTASGSVASTVTRERSSPATEAANLRRRASSSRMAIIFLAPSSSSVKNLAFTTPPPRCFASLRPAPRTLASPTPHYIGASGSGIEAIVRGDSVQSNGDIVVVGNQTTSAQSGTTIVNGLAWLTPNGNLDPTFGTGGTVVNSVPAGTDGLDGAVIQADGNIITVGAASNLIELTLARLLGN